MPPNGKKWVDAIRQKGNEANHEIHLMGEKDARNIVRFSEMLLRFIYDMPNLYEAEEPNQGDATNQEPTLCLGSFVMRTSFLSRAVADLVSR